MPVPRADIQTAVRLQQPAGDRPEQADQEVSGSQEYRQDDAGNDTTWTTLYTIPQKDYRDSKVYPILPR